MTENTTNIDALIEEQQREIARECFRDAWENAIGEGLDPGIVAETIIERTLREVARTQGNHAASQLIAHFSELDRLGFLPASQTLQ